MFRLATQVGDNVSILEQGTVRLKSGPCSSQSLAWLFIGNLHKSHWGLQRLQRSCTQVLGHTQAFGYPTGATHRCLSMSMGLDLEPGLRTGVWIV